MSSYVVKKERCPECEKSGRDRRGDNLAVYNDGHKFCFSCGFYQLGDQFYKLRQHSENEIVKTDFSLPDDIEPALGGAGWRWISQYGITPEEIIRHRILWSEKLQWLIYTYWENDELTLWQARNFNPEKKYKYLTRGNVRNTLWINPGIIPFQLCITEDLVSAYKVARYTDSMAILGSVITLDTLSRLRRYYEDIIIWLDPDKQKEMIKFSQLAQLLGFKVKTIFSDKDPKEHTDDYIMQQLQSW